MKTSFTKLLSYLFSRENEWLAKAKLEAPKTLGWGLPSKKYRKSMVSIMVKKILGQWLRMRQDSTILWAYSQAEYFTVSLESFNLD